jgi:hypothetical protein
MDKLPSLPPSLPDLAWTIVLHQLPLADQARVCCASKEVKELLYNPEGQLKIRHPNVDPQIQLSLPLQSSSLNSRLHVPYVDRKMLVETALSPLLQSNLEGLGLTLPNPSTLASHQLSQILDPLSSFKHLKAVELVWKDCLKPLSQGVDEVGLDISLHHVPHLESLVLDVSLYMRSLALPSRLLSLSLVFKSGHCPIPATKLCDILMELPSSIKFLSVPFPSCAVTTTSNASVHTCDWWAPLSKLTKLEGLEIVGGRGRPAVLDCIPTSIADLPSTLLSLRLGPVSARALVPHVLAHLARIPAMHLSVHSLHPPAFVSPLSNLASFEWVRAVTNEDESWEEYDNPEDEEDEEDDDYNAEGEQTQHRKDLFTVDLTFLSSAPKLQRLQLDVTAAGGRQMRPSTQSSKELTLLGLSALPRLSVLCIKGGARMAIPSFPPNLASALLFLSAPVSSLFALQGVEWARPPRHRIAPAPPPPLMARMVGVEVVSKNVVCIGSDALYALPPVWLPGMAKEMDAVQYNMPCWAGSADPCDLVDVWESM